MRREIANLVHPVLAHGLSLREKLLRGEEPVFEAEQAALLGLLLGEREARRWPEYGGDDFAAVQPAASEMAVASGPFLGARYALVCWLDEMFILDTPWSQRWTENKLEMRLYASNDRAWKFWDQAKLAAERQGVDALGAYFLCVMLGFTGDHGDSGQLVPWIAATREQLRRVLEGQWRSPAGMEPATSVPPLRGRKALRRMLLLASVVLLAVVPIVALFLARRLT